MKTLGEFIKKNKLESFSIFLIILLALCLRLYRISEFMTFLGDEGRDVRIVRDLITKGNLVFIGPQTSIGNMYLGPLYYYIIAPALFLSRLNPVGPAVLNALIGTFTVLLTYFIGRKLFDKWSGLIAALLYAVSPVAIIYSRSSWNPNPMPLFALLCIWGIYQVWQNKQYFWLPLVGIFFALALQMHYLGLLLGPVLGLFWIVTLISINKSKDLLRKKTFLHFTLFAFLSFFILMSPLLLFDLKHQGMNFNAFKAFFTDRQTTVNLNPAKSDRFLPVIYLTVSDLILARQTTWAPLASILILLFSVLIYLKSKWFSSLKTIFVWLGFAILGLSVYKQHIYIHYLGFIYPAIYLLEGALLGFLLKQKTLFGLIAITLIVFLFANSIIFSPVRENPNRQLQRTEQAVDLILKESDGQPFNFGLIAKQNYDESYRYFLENKNTGLIRGEDKIVDQLFVICEDGANCQPEGHPAWQIAKFGPSHVVGQWQIDYLKIYRLVHTK
ncbi:phospholipid carrier-dependent glycosyltransferase [bacterium]|nr:phospholipid carrier-dependent glycosyltransferase [bacterium]